MKILRRSPRAKDLTEGRSVFRHLPGKGLFEYAKYNGKLYEKSWETSKEVIKRHHYIRVGIDYNQSAGTFVVLPLDGGTTPATTFHGAGKSSCMIAPFSGELVKIMFRSEEVAGNPVVIGFHKMSDGTETPTNTPTSSVSIDMSGIADDTTTSFIFSTNNIFAKGDILGFSIDPANDINDSMFLIVLKYTIE